MTDVTNYQKLSQTYSQPSPYIHLVHKTFRLPTGKEKQYDIVDVPDVVFIFPLTPNGQVVACKQFRPGPEKVMYEIPAGFMDEGEQPIETAARELQEETGYQGELSYVQTYYGDAYRNNAAHVFVAQSCTKKDDQQLDESECIEVELLSVEQIRQSALSGSMTMAGACYIALDYLGLLGAK